MIYAFFYGLATGIILSSMLGTVFFFLVQNSIDNGFKSGMFISAGVIISDVLLILLSWFNNNLIPAGSKTEMGVRLAGSCFLAFLGFSSVYGKRGPAFPVTKRSGILLLSAKGFILNTFNPGNFISWLSVTALLLNVLHFNAAECSWFYSGALISIFGMEVLISLGASYLKKYLTKKLMHLINLALGIAFFVFAFILLLPVLKKFF